ncbi:hypothetical protein [Streptomyces sp. NPDC048565]|uniref:hypothetical protein n=1 Tax=Streptomyces sp. NPDC048565 TaxID=3155266 RepID=UPI00343CF27B
MSSGIRRRSVLTAAALASAAGEQLDGREFTWLRVPLDDGLSGRKVDLELSSEEERTWHLSACVVLADGAPCGTADGSGSSGRTVRSNH